jgi:alpha/beta superfamily hydrolase
VSKGQAGEKLRIGPNTVLPAHRTKETLHTADGLDLAAELAVPKDHAPRATLILVHPLPTAGGSMDSHLYRKAANRLPALADFAVLRFNTRGTASESGLSQGLFNAGGLEKHDLDAAISFAKARFLPRIWLVGWSFGSDVVLLYGDQPGVEGVILLSPPLLRADDTDLKAWNRSGKHVKVLVPGFDDYLRPVAAAARFKQIQHAKLISVPGAPHLWTGEKFVSRVLNEIVDCVSPGSPPLPETWPHAGNASPN